MKINLFKIFLILAIISFFIVPFIAGNYDSYITSKKPMCFEGLGCLKEEVKQEALKEAREEISQRPFITRYELNLGSSFVYWYFWFIPLIFLGLAWYINNRKKKIPKYCQFEDCNNNLNIYSHKCLYCSQYHCSEHILAENHKCPNPLLPYDMKKGYGVKKQREIP